MKKGKTRDGNPQLVFSFYIDNVHYYVRELWTKYPVSFMTGVGGRPVFFNWDGEKWLHDIPDEELAGKIIEQLELGYESKIL